MLKVLYLNWLVPNDFNKNIQGSNPSFPNYWVIKKKKKYKVQYLGEGLKIIVQKELNYGGLNEYIIKELNYGGIKYKQIYHLLQAHDSKFIISY